MSSERPEIFFICLALQPFFDDSYSSLINGLLRVARVKRTRKADGAIRYLEANSPKAVFVTDDGFTDHKAVVEKVRAYVEKGGFLFIGLHFPNFTHFTEIDNLFGGTFGLEWRCASYQRSTFLFNPSCTLPEGAREASFPSKFHMKVLHIENAKKHEMILVPEPEERTHGKEAAVVGTEYGEGYLVYAGDVNPGKDSDKVILALLGF